MSALTIDQIKKLEAGQKVLIQGMKLNGADYSKQVVVDRVNNLDLGNTIVRFVGTNVKFSMNDATLYGVNFRRVAVDVWFEMV